MLPPRPAAIVDGDFDPSQPLEDEDMEMRSDTDQPKHQIHAVEINILIYLYLLESNFTHTAFSLLAESNLKETSLFQHFNPTWPTSKPNSGKGAANGPSKHSPATSTFGEPNGRIERGELVRHLWNSVRWEEIERHCGDNGEVSSKKCPNPFHLLIPHTCPASLSSASQNPPQTFPTIRMSPPPEEKDNDVEAFPPPIHDNKDNDEEDSQPAAGPSRRKQDVTTDKRDQRRDSEGSTTRTRSTTPVSQNRRKLDEDEPMPEETQDGQSKEEVTQTETPTPIPTIASGRRKRQAVVEEKEKSAASTPKSTTKDRLSVPMTTSRSKSPAKRDKTTDVLKLAQKKGQGNPRWIQQGDVGLFTEHRDVVTCVAWNSKNVDQLASTSLDSTARFWELKQTSDEPGSRGLTLASKSTLLNHKSIEGHRKAINALSWHPDGTLLATGAGDGLSRMFTPNGSLEGILAYGRQSVNAIKFSPSGRLLLTATDEPSVNLFNATNDPPLKRSYDSHASGVNDVDWYDDVVFASCSNDHQVHIFRTDVRRPVYTFIGHLDDVTQVRWSPSLLLPDGRVGRKRGKYLASVADDGRLIIWEMDVYPPFDPEAQRKANSLPVSAPGSVSPKHEEDDYNFDIGSNSRDKKKKRVKKESSDGEDEDEGPMMRHMVAKWLVVNKSQDKRMVALEWSPEYHKDRMLVAAGGQDCTIKVYDVVTRSHFHSLQGLEYGTGCLTFAPKGFRSWTGKYGQVGMGAIAGGGWGAQFKIWDVETGKILKEYELNEEDHQVLYRDRPFFTSTSWRSDGNQIALGMWTKQIITLYVGDIVKGEEVVIGDEVVVGLDEPMDS